MTGARTRLLKLAPMLIGVMVFASACASNAPQDTFKPEGPQARKIDNLIMPVFGLAGVVFVLVLGEWYPAALNIGSNPTFDGTRQPRCEAHIIGLNEELYGEGLTLFIIRCLREERKFDSAEDLKAQIALDTAECERVGTRYIQSDRTNLMKFASCL